MEFKLVLKKYSHVDIQGTVDEGLDREFIFV